MASAWLVVLATASSVAASSVASPVSPEPRREHTSGLAAKKSSSEATTAPLLLGTLVDTHTGVHVVLDAEHPEERRFDALLADRATGAEQHLDPRLLDLLRTLARSHSGARFELVSGYRSPKLNEMLRKKGRHVASHSQHSLGHALDFRIVPPDSDTPVDPCALESEIRATRWTGGTGTYLGEHDRFVHADVGPNRRWNGL